MPSRLLIVCLPVCAAVGLPAAASAQVKPAKPKKPAQVIPAVPEVALASSPAPARQFDSELALLDRVVACRENGTAIPESWTKVVAKHCAIMARWTDAFRKRYVERATPFFAKLKPADLPDRVVYPFGGGDLVSALVTYPGASEVTTMSLEHAGDPTQLDGLGPYKLSVALRDLRAQVRGLLKAHDSTTVNLQASQHGPLPGQLSFFLIGTAALGYEPVSLRFFKLEDDGSIHYYSAEEVEALDDRKARQTKRNAAKVTHSPVFSNAELIVKKDGVEVVHRHVAANLDNRHFRDSALHKHLTAKGQVVAMTKAASYLLWLGAFAAIRNYLMSNAVFMVSDSTGVPPRYARKAGMTQTTYGRFAGPFLEASDKHAEAFRQLWASQPRRKLPFRYGYIDSAGSVHMIVTKRKDR